jgi:hypothetical protein
VKDKAGKQAYLSNADQHVGSHEMGSTVEILFGIGKENVCIHVTMHNKKDHQKNSGERHNNLFADGR